MNSLDFTWISNLQQIFSEVFIISYFCLSEENMV